MRIARLDTPIGPRHAVAVDDRWEFIVDPFAAPLVFAGDSTPIAGAELLSAIEPRVVIGIAHNLTNNDHPLPIQAWHKSVHTVAAPGDDILAARGVGTVNIEGELAVVMGRSASNLTEKNAFDAVLGFTIANDVTNVDQGVDEKAFQSKSGVNYTPLGPWIETEIADPENVSTDIVINGETVVRSGSFNLPSTVAATLAYVTSWLTLEAGDVVMTGSPKTWAPVVPGDRVDITLAGIGTLSNAVV
jgi:2-keto-4-pentenoate hydratase/2-oxohepta-3-ene-1,7-dioic acid hydratase in catechol pathway